MRFNTEPGFLLIDKPTGPTSHAVVRTVKRLLAAESVGHLGTLDPFASGLLPVLLGGANRLAELVHDGDKGYRFVVQFGSETDTLDGTGKVLSTAPVADDFALRLADAIPGFLGEIEQVPPLYSAIKMDGLALYEHMRATGKLPRDIETKRRVVTIHKLELLRSWQDGESAFAELRVLCRKGTYIRSLARDLARAVGTLGFCAVLRRECVEPWCVEEALVLDPKAPPTPESLAAAVRPVESLVPALPRIALPPQYESFLRSGNLQILDASLFCGFESSGRALVSCGDIQFLCEVEPLGDAQIRCQPRKKIR